VEWWGGGGGERVGRGGGRSGWEEGGERVEGVGGKGGKSVGKSVGRKRMGVGEGLLLRNKYNFNGQTQHTYKYFTYLMHSKVNP
jgi:hypothetical protein